jgi:hypothetical protein
MNKRTENFVLKLVVGGSLILGGGVAIDGSARYAVQAMERTDRLARELDGQDSQLRVETWQQYSAARRESEVADWRAMLIEPVGGIAMGLGGALAGHEVWNESRRRKRVAAKAGK